MNNLEPNVYHSVNVLSDLSPESIGDALTSVYTDVVIIDKIIGVVTGFIQYFHRKHNDVQPGQLVFSSNDGQKLENVTHVMVPAVPADISKNIDPIAEKGGKLREVTQRALVLRDETPGLSWPDALKQASAELKK